MPHHASTTALSGERWHDLALCGMIRTPNPLIKSRRQPVFYPGHVVCGQPLCPILFGLFNVALPTGTVRCHPAPGHTLAHRSPIPARMMAVIAAGRHQLGLPESSADRLACSSMRFATYSGFGLPGVRRVRDLALLPGSRLTREKPQRGSRRSYRLPRMPFPGYWCVAKLWLEGGTTAASPLVKALAQSA